MANVCLSILLVVLNVNYFVSSSVAEIDTEDSPGIFYIEELDEHKDAYTKVVSMRNGKRNKLSASDQLCHKAHTDCLGVVTSADLICAQHRRYGLVNFPSLCEIRFQNCLIKSRENKSGRKNKHGNFYYNGKLVGCEYYVEKTNTVSDAVKLYFMADKDYEMYNYTKNNPKSKNAKELILDSLSL